MASSISVPPVPIPHMERANNRADHAESVRGSASRANGVNAADLPARVGAVQALPEEGNVAEAAQKVRDFLQITRRDLEFSVDKESGQTIIRVLDAATGELVRQIPPDEVLAIAKRLDQPEGILFRGHA